MPEVIVGPTNLALDVLGIIGAFRGLGRDYELEDFMVTPGGSPLNIAVGVRRLGHSSGAFGAYGADKMGVFCKHSLVQEDVDTTFLGSDETLQTYTAFVLVESLQQRRTIYANTRGHNGTFQIDQNIRDYVSQARIYGTHGGILFRKDRCKSIVELFLLARNNGVLTFLDPSENPDEQDIEVLRPILQHTSIFLPGHAEALAVTGENDIVRATSQLLEYGPEIIAVKLGKEGCLVASKTELCYSPGFQVREKDLTGAGDAFAAGFLTGILEGWSLRASAEFGNAYAACNIRSLGPRAGMVSRHELLAFINKQQNVRNRSSGGYVDSLKCK
jgi:2-dehydro-3-deoxygluconokinase